MSLLSLPNELLFAHIAMQLPIKDFVVFTTAVSKSIAQIDDECAASVIAMKVSHWQTFAASHHLGNIFSKSKVLFEKTLFFFINHKKDEEINCVFFKTISGWNLALMNALSKCNLTWLKLGEFFPDLVPVEDLAKSLPQLTQLNLHVSSEGEVKALAQWSSLKKLHIDLLNAGLSKTLSHLASLHLEVLDINAHTHLTFAPNWPNPPPVTAFHLTALQKTTTLTALSFACATFAATDSMAALGNLSKITDLTFEKCDVGDSLVESLTHLKGLSVLEFCSCSVSPEAIAGLKKTSPHLQVLVT